METEVKPADRIRAILAEAGIEMTAAHVPTTFRPEWEGTRERKEGDWNHIAWRVTFKGKRGEFSTDYRQGIGHLPDGLKPGWGGVKYEQGKAIAATLETGRIHVPMPIGSWRTHAPTKNPLPPPDVADVVACLVLDASAADYASYDEWAADYGSDPDSRKGERAYQACRDTALNLFRVFGADVVEKLKEPCAEL